MQRPLVQTNSYPDDSRLFNNRNDTFNTFQTSHSYLNQTPISTTTTAGNTLNTTNITYPPKQQLFKSHSARPNSTYSSIKANGNTNNIGECNSKF